MTERVARIPLVRTRRRRPKPPRYWIFVAVMVWLLANFGVTVFKLLYQPNPATALLAAELVLGVVCFRRLSRAADPDDETPDRVVSPLTVSLFLAGGALDITRWCLYGFNSG